MDSVKIKSAVESNPNFKQTRLQSLYSNFNHLKQVNPEGYEANLLAGKSLLLELIEQCPEVFTDKLCFDSNNLVNQLSLYAQKPKGLNKVLDFLINEDKSVIPYSIFQREAVVNKQESFLDSVRRILRNVSRSKFASGVNNEDGTLVKNEKFILIGQLVRYSNKIKEFLKTDNTTPILTNHLYEVLEDKLTLSKFDLECCLTYLSRDLGEVQLLPEGVICMDSTNKYTQLSAEQLQSIAELKYSIYQISKYNEQTAEKIETSKSKTRELVKRDQTVRAKSELKLQRLLSQKLEKSQSNLENLSLLLCKIEENSSNVMTVKTLEANSQILRHLNDQVGDIEGVVEQVRDELEKSEEVHQHMGLVKEEEEEEGDDEIEQELDRLEREEKGESVEERGEESADEALRERFERLKLPTSPLPAPLPADKEKNTGPERVAIPE